MSRLVINVEPDDVGVLRVGPDGNFHEAPYDPAEWQVFHETFEMVAFIGAEPIEVRAKPER